MFLWPNSLFTCRISLVLWYSIVAFQWRSVWNDISKILGLLSLWAILFLWIWKLHRWLANRPLPKILSDSLERAFSIPTSLVLTLITLGFPCFSGSTVTVCRSASRSTYLKDQASPDLTPVSFSNWRNVAIFLLQDEIKASISVSRGRKGNFSWYRYSGGCQ